MKQVDYLIVANLMSGKGQAEERLQEVKTAVNSQGGSYETVEIRKPKRISKIILNDTTINKGVICIGGDGTVSETVGLMINNNIAVPLRIIPTGTANIIRGTLGIGGYGGEEYAGDVGGENDKKTIKVDVGVVDYGGEKNYFLLGIGLGFEEKFIELAKSGLKKRFGPFSYIFTALRELFTLKPLPIELKTKSVKKNLKVALLLVFNLQPKILKAFPLFPFKDIKGDDGWLNIFYVEYHNKFLAILGTLLFHVLGRVNFGLVKHIITNDISLSSPLSCKSQIDGEIRGELPVRIISGTKIISIIC